ncbi:MAG TPA: plastocyanin/azurin family copper-binding protein [Gemmatimonadaceae bacterium]|nr:plastocyanin/azurin family copper-binding protein [Gemmatimonadaceae bacterium]
MTSYRRLVLAAFGATMVAACRGGERQGGGGAADSAQAGAAAGTGAAADEGAATPDAGGKVIVVEALTDEQGNNIFRPADFTARKGDVIRYTLVSGVHNVHFLADSNPGKLGLPAAGELLQLPGQTHDVKVSFAPGTHYYQCDPHALLGMKGHVTVTP